jgi:KaiC/GvpD/RAD55 family RecA-like ATPase
MEKMLETKIKGLDKALGGGLPSGACVLITTDVPEKTAYFYLDFLYQGLKVNQPAILIATDRSPEEIRIEALKRNQVFSRFEESLMRWIDVYSLSAGMSPDENPAVNRVSSYLSLYDITVSASIFQSQFYRMNQAHRLVLDSLSTLIMKNNSQTVMRFLKVITEKTKKAGGTSVFVMKSGLYDYLLPELDKVVDARFSIFQTDKGTVFKIARFPGMVEKELELKVTPTGAELE